MHVGLGNEDFRWEWEGGGTGDGDGVLDEWVEFEFKYAMTMSLHSFLPSRL